MTGRWMPWAAMLGAALIVLSALSACGRDSGGTDQGYAKELSSRITTDAVWAHLERLQEIADANGGTRQTGTPGYDDSVDYVVKALQDKGFSVTTPEFELGIFRVATESLALDGVPVPARAVEYSGTSTAAGVSGPLVVVPSDDDTPGCEPSDYDGLPVDGATVLVERGGCFLADKAAAATGRGAVGMVIANDADEKVFSAAFIESEQVKIPVVSVSKADGATLRGQQGTATVVVDSRIDHVRARSVIAQTTTGSTQNVVVAGAHLDSVRVSPGINDNGTGVATLLETALQMGSAPPVSNAVRFAFFGGEEEWLVGSIAYVKSLDVESLEDVAMYLNFDTVGSPNPGYLVLDGDATAPADPGGDLLPPQGSAGIEQTLVDYLVTVGKTAGRLPFDGRGDYDPFARTGIPSGALCTGTEQLMTADEAGLWGGKADQAFDPNYHSADDTLANVSRAALDVTGPAIAYVVGRYAHDQGGDTGVPSRQERIRQLLPDS